MPTFLHSAFGLRIQSDFELAGFPKAHFDTADVTIRSGSVAPALVANCKEPVTHYRTWEASSGHFLLSLENIAKFLVVEGNQVIIERAYAVTDEEIMVYFTSSVLAALLQQRGLLTLHASAVHTPKGAVLFMGRSGAGKSTLCRAMQQRGFAMMSDDASAISFDASDLPLLTPSIPTSRLWEDSLRKLSVSAASGQRLRTELSKYLVPAVSFHNEKQKVFKIFSLTEHNQTDIVANELDAAGRFQNLSLFTFRKNFYPAQGLADLYFESVMKIVNSTPVVKIARPSKPFAIEELVDTVMGKLDVQPEQAEAARRQNNPAD